MNELPTESTASTADAAIAQPPKEEAAQDVNQASQLIKLAEGCELFHTSSNVPFASCKVDGHRENYPLRSSEFENWLRGGMHRCFGNAPTPQVMGAALGVLQARACFSGPLREVYVRVAEHEGDIFIDLADRDWRVVRVSADAGYSVLSESPVKFKRPKGLLALPEPQSGGRIEDLRPFVNIGDDRQWRLLVGFILGAFHPTGPYPILEVNGDQGSGKSVMTKVLRLLVDPNVAPARSLGNLHDLALAANNGWLLGFDNLSFIRKHMSDALCRVSTGGASARRTLYEDEGETIFEAKRPVVLNGIGNFITESDLLDRTLVLQLPAIRSAQRQDERQFWKNFTEVQPKIFGALLDAVSCAMRTVDSVPARTDWPRMMDFAKWVTAAEGQLGWKSGSFMEAYNENREEANARVIDDDKFAQAIIDLANTGGWSGTASELLPVVNPGGDAGFPQAANKLKQRLSELTPNLQAIGVPVESAREGRDSKKMIYIGKRIVSNDRAA
jgi:hypothetical protein